MSYLKSLAKSLMFSWGERLPMLFNPFKGEYDIVFIFPLNDLSGSTRVHLDIVSLFSNRRLLVFFTAGISKPGLLNEFRSVSRVQIVKWRVLRSYYLGLMVKYINKKKPGYVAGMGTPYFYKVISRINQNKTSIIDIIHAVSGLDFIPDSLFGRINKRVVIDEATRDALLGKPGISSEKVILIHNKTEIPEYTSKKENSKLSILFIGRGTYEKRAHLLPLIAAVLRGSIEFEIIIIGDFDESFEFAESEFSFQGQIKDRDKLSEFYHNSDVLLLVSSREGIPMVMIEAMAHGTIPVCTPVGGIPYHIKNGENGYIINGNDESELVRNSAAIIIQLFHDRNLLRSISKNSHEYSKIMFSEQKFSDSYNELFKIR